MTLTDNEANREIRKIKSNESDEFITLMEIAFKDTIEEDRIDADEVRSLMKKIQSPVFRALARAVGMRTEFFVADVAGTIASGILLNIEKDEVYVGDLMTLPQYRRRGLARDLLRLSFRRAHQLGRKRVGLDARADNVNAVSLYTSEGFETTYHTGRFESDSAVESTKTSSTDLTIHEISKISFQEIDAMLDDCFPASHLEIRGREKYVKDLIPSRAIRFFAKRLGGQSINTYAIHVNDEEKPRVYMQASQSRIEDRIRLSSPILSEKDNDLLLEAIPRILELETSYRGLTTASVNCWIHRTDAISKIESLGFKKVRESISMTKHL
ncbi:MAG: GNAT family N-acetyltransferase [Candidatus Thorarchaeota archaeon]